jgi:hypothetical protein
MNFECDFDYAMRFLITLTGTVKMSEWPSCRHISIIEHGIADHRVAGTFLLPIMLWSAEHGVIPKP